MGLCTTCGASVKTSESCCGTCGTLQNPVTGESESWSEVNSHDLERDRTAGIVCLVAAGLVALGSFFPYVVIVTTIGISVSRNAFQFGPGATLTYAGPLILLGAAFFVYDGLILMGVLPPIGRVRSYTPLGSSIVAAAFIANAWNTSGWSVTVHLGDGGIVSLAGVLAGVVALIVRKTG